MLYFPPPKAETQGQHEVTSREGGECEDESPAISPNITPKGIENDIPNVSVDVEPTTIPLPPSLTVSPLPFSPGPVQFTTGPTRTDVLPRLPQPPSPFLLPSHTLEEVPDRPDDEVDEEGGLKVEGGNNGEKPDPSQPKTETQEPRKVVSHKSDECQDKPATTLSDFPQTAGIISSEGVDAGTLSDNVKTESAKTPIPHSTAASPSPPTSRPVPPVQYTSEPIPSPQPPFPPPLPVEGSEETPDSSSEEDGLDKEDSFGGPYEEKSLPSVSHSSIAPSPPLTTLRPIPSQSEAETRESPDISDESDERQDEPSIIRPDLPQHADLVSNEDEGFFGDNTNIELAEVPTLPFVELPLASLNTRPVLLVRPAPDLTEITEPTPPITPQSSEDSGKGGPNEEGPDPSLPPPPTRQSVTSSPSRASLPIPSIPKSETQELNDFPSHEIEEYEEPSTIVFNLPQCAGTTSEGVGGVPSDCVDEEPVEVHSGPPVQTVPGRKIPAEIPVPTPSPPNPSLSLQFPQSRDQIPDISNEKGDNPSMSLPVGRPSVVPPPLLTTTVRPKAEAKTPESHEVDFDESEEYEQPTMPSDLPRPTEPASDIVEDEGFLSEIVNVEPVKAPTPPPFAEPPLTPLTSRLALPVQFTSDTTEAPETTPPHPPSPSPPPPQEDRLANREDSSGEGPDEEKPNPALSQSSAPSPLPPIASPPVLFVPTIRTQEPHEVVSHGNIERGDESPKPTFDLSKPIDVASGKVENESFSGTSVDAELADVPTPPPSTFLLPPLPTSQPVLPVKLTPEPTETPEVSSSPQPQPQPSPPLPEQALEEGLGGLSEEDSSGGESGSDQADDPEEDGPIEEGRDPSLPSLVGRPSVALPPLLTTASQLKAERQGPQEVATDENDEDEDELLAVPLVLPQTNDVVADAIEVKGLPDDNVGGVLPVQHTPDPVEPPEPSLESPSPPPRSPQNPEGRLANPSEENEDSLDEGSCDEEEAYSDLPLPLTGRESITPPPPPAASPLVHFVQKDETQEPHESEEDEYLPRDGGETPMLALFTSHPPSPLASQPVPSGQLTLDSTETPKSRVYPQPPSPPLPEQILEKPGGANDVDSDERSFDEEDSLDKVSPNEEEHDPSQPLPVGRPSVVLSRLLTAAS